LVNVQVSATGNLRKMVCATRPIEIVAPGPAATPEPRRRFCLSRLYLSRLYLSRLYLPRRGKS
jgi:hypothetical protein